MSDLEGRIEVFEPIAILQLLNLAQVTGELVLDTDNNAAHVYFDRGNVTFAGITNRPLKLGELLLREKRIKRKDLDRILEKKAEGKRLGDLLIEAGVIAEDELRYAVEEQIKEVIYEVVRWHFGSFSFTKDTLPRRQDILIDIPLDHLMLEGLKRLDEERKKI
jgi:hypothetical protein